MAQLDDIIEELTAERERLTDLQVEANLAFTQATDPANQTALLDIIDDAETQLRLITRNIIILKTNRPAVRDAYETIMGLASQSKAVAAEMSVAEDKVKALGAAITAATSLIKAVSKLSIVG